MYELTKMQDGMRNRRISSYDKSGNNRDHLSNIEPGETRTIAEISGAGIINHIWITIAPGPDRLNRSDLILRMYWDGNTYPLAVTANPVPNVSGWKWSRVALPAAANDKAVAIEHESANFSLGYFAYGENALATYGYLSAFNRFQFPNDTIYKCPDDAVTLEGGYAIGYTWKHAATKSGPYTTLSETGYSLSVTQEGFYILEMNQDPDIVKDTVYVRNLNFQTAITGSTTSGVTTFYPSVNPALANDPNLRLSYSWEFEGGTPATSTAENPVVTWTGTEHTAKLTVTGEANSASSTGSCISTTYLYLMPDVEVCMKKTDITLGEGLALPAGTYQWQSSKDKVMWTNISEATNSTFTIPAQSQKRGITFYRVLLGDGTNPPVATDAVRVRFKSCQLPVNHNISVMGWDD